MRFLNGYVCVAGVERDSYTQQLLFGKSVGNKGKRYENLQTNGVKIYDTLSDAIEGSHELEEANGFSTIDVKNLRMLIGEKLEDLEKLRRGRSLIVIQLERDRDFGGNVVTWRLLGPRMKGRPDLLPLPAPGR